MKIILILVVLFLIVISAIFLWRVVAGIITWYKIKRNGEFEIPPVKLTKELVIGGIVEHSLSLIIIISAIILIVQCKHS